MTSLPAGKLPTDLLHSLLSKHAPSDPQLLIGPGIGRDSAAIAFGETILVAKSDPITFPTTRTALHLVHVNANDIACQGGTPRWLLVTALLPLDGTTDGTVARLFGDLNEEARKINISVIGGHTEITDAVTRPVLVGTLLGETDSAGLIHPANAQVGHRLLLTKTAGIEGTAVLSAAATEQLRALGWSDVDLMAAHAMIDDPGISVVPEARALAMAGAVSAMHDPTEGGVISAVRELAQAAGCGAYIRESAVAVAPITRRMCADLGIDPFGLLASGSLLAAVPPELTDTAAAALESVGVPFNWIGKLIQAEQGMRLGTTTGDVPLPDYARDEVARVLSGVVE